ncbi:hypothetical protein SISSUDRAFT_743305 [Sistotremastrum suecicum HHB10207 ss-3]|nr:hypothetical protein SISSUDRAFT_743305 [Sistotremastrum suecicum HHB10207 ss-3]
MNQESFVVDPRPAFPCFVSAIRYTPVRKSTDISRQRGLSLILLHAIGLHKETWQPVVERMFDEASGEQNICEAWSIEYPDHGQSAVINDEILSSIPPGSWGPQNYADAIYSLITGMPGGHDLLQRDLVLVSHSFGAYISPFLLQAKPRIPFRSAILIDSYLCPPNKKRDTKGSGHIAFALNRVASWANRAAAARHLARHPFTKPWTLASRDLFIRYGLRQLKITQLPLADAGEQGLELTCTREREAAMYHAGITDTEGIKKLEQLFSSALPIHLIFCK